MNKVNDKGPDLDILIFDLRGNIGGAIDQLPYFLGPFIGFDNYAYQFYQQGKKDDFKTTTGWLDSMVRYKKVVVLIDEKSQSTAEVTAAVLKKYNVGVLVGNTTKGWGTIEKVFPIDNQIKTDEKFSLFLVHHVTIGDEGQPIEGRGVAPNISIKDPNWKNELFRRFGSQEIVDQVATILSQ
jgi:carboxyl-terminal processing protease